MYSNIENYILHFKKINKNDNIIIKNIKIFLKKYIDNYGYINTGNLNLIQDFKILLKFLLEKKNLNNVITLLDNSDIYFKSFNNQKIFYKEYFEDLAVNFSSLITTNILYDEISQLIFIIYIYGTTINNFDYYILNNENIIIDIKLKKIIKILSNYIKTKNILETFNFNSNSFKILILGHLHYENFLNHKKIIVENLNFTYGRIVLEILKNRTDITKHFVKKLYDLFQEQYTAPSTPMFYNSLKKYNLLSSCFILNMEDSVNSISNCINKIFNIQKHNSGIGIVLNKIRSENRPVMNGVTTSNSISHLINILSLISNHYDNKTRNRSSNMNINISIYHPEILNFLKIKVNNFKKENLFHNKIFQTISIPDEFIYRYLKGEKWYLISSDQHLNGKYLYNYYGDEFSKLYNEMINDQSIIKHEICSEFLLSEIINTMIKTGGPFLFFDDIINKTSNHKNLGKIQGTNLCTEILEYTNENETACCNLSSINLSKIYYIKNNKKYFDFKLFKKIIKKVVFYLNCSIDNTYYSHETCKNFNMLHRPIGIGIQGLANLFNILNINYIDGQKLYKQIIEYMYYYSLKYSNKYCKNKIFEECSEKSNNIKTNFKFHFELFEEVQQKKKNKLISNNFNDLANFIDLNNYKSTFISNDKWNILKKRIIKNGLSNSLLLAFMPTSMSSSIYNNNESFEPFNNLIEKKTISVYDIITYNQELVKQLLDKKYLDEKTILKELIINNGKIEKLNIPENIKLELSKIFNCCLYDLDINDYLKFTNIADCFVDQGISFNISEKNNDNILIGKIIIASWLLGKKTTYYYRTNTIIEPLSFNKDLNTQNNVCTRSCKSCST